VSEYYQLESEIANSDIVFTGEGTYDETSKTGKVPSQVFIASFLQIERAV
jgi:glycerate kinase